MDEIVTQRPTPEDHERAAAAIRAEFETLPSEPIRVRIATAIKLTGIPRPTLYELIRPGEIEPFQIGRSTFIPSRSLKPIGSASVSERVRQDLSLLVVRVPLQKNNTSNYTT